MGLLSLFTVVMVLILPKTGGDTTVGVVFGMTLPAAVIALGFALVRGDFVALQWSRRTSPVLYLVVGAFLVLTVVLQFIEPRAEFAYYLALAGIFVGNLFMSKPVTGDSRAARRQVQPSMVVSAVVLGITAIGVTVWAVVAIVDNYEALANALILASVILWVGALVSIMRLHGLFWAPRRARVTLGSPETQK